MNFKRSPSKVWWGSESLEFREVSSSPGSQDSGFSDTEGSPRNSERNTGQTVAEQTPRTTRKLARTLQKEKQISRENLNLTINYKEKCTPIKEQIERLIKSDQKTVRKPPEVANAAFTEPLKKSRYIKHSPKVHRNLFTDKNAKECPHDTNQYSKLTPPSRLRSTQEQTNEEEENSGTSYDCDTSSDISGTKSLPLSDKSSHVTSRLTKSAPEDYYEAVTSFNSSDCESELDHIFDELDGPGHTSTPKGSDKNSMRYRRRLRLNDQQRVPPISTDGVTVDNAAVLMWLREARFVLEQECTITLQSKSIAGELNQKVSHLAACTTTILRGLLSQSRCIEADYQQLNNEPSKQKILDVATGIEDFLKTHTCHLKSETLYDEAQTLSETLKALRQMFGEWESIRNKILIKEVTNLISKLEDPTSDIDLRATLTGITSVALRNTDLIKYFLQAEIVPILLILCERCDGSSMRTLILRALSTMCTESSAIRHFEKFSGIQTIAEILEEESRPEPERSEAVALLAQVTAPWMEDNKSIKGLQEYSEKLVIYLTRFSSSTKCCQNLLLCAAALANLSSMDTQSVTHLVEYSTAPTLMTAIQTRGPLISVYLLEQVATLLANMAASDVARKQLINAEAPLALLHFLRSPRFHQHEELERKLQQKSVIALSRLCGDIEASKQIVNGGGVRRLVQLCREKHERFNSDAVLVAALATLRKIVEACGKEVLDEQDCQELVEPKLLDSFLAYSSQNESYV